MNENSDFFGIRKEIMETMQVCAHACLYVPACVVWVRD